MSIHVPRFVIEPEHSFLNLSRIQSCSWSFRLGIVHETVNMIDLVISEATLDEHVIRTPVWINPNTSVHSVCVCHVLCCQEVLKGLSRTSCNSFIPAIRKKSPVQSIFLVSLLLKEHQNQFVSVRFCEGLACAILAWPTHQEFHRAGESIEVQSAFSHHRWIPQPGLPPQKCSLQDSRREQGHNWKSSSTFAIFDVNRTATCSATSVARSVQFGSIKYFNIG